MLFWDNRHKKAQHLIEFVFVVPILMIFLMICIEMGLAVNAKLTLTEAVKASIGQVNQISNQEGTDAQKITALQSNTQTFIQNYLLTHNIPFADSVKTTISSNNPMLLIATYTYIPQFTLPNIYGAKIIPEKYEFIDTQIINDNLLKSSAFNSGFTYDDLGLFWADNSGTINPASILKGGSVNGISETSARNTIAFLVQFTNGVRAFAWDGSALLPNNIMINLSTGNLEKDNGVNWSSSTATAIPYYHYLIAKGISQAIYVEPATLYAMETAKSSAQSYGLKWCAAGACGGDISTQDTIIKEALRLYKNTEGAVKGTFDKINLLSADKIKNDYKTYTYIDSNYLLLLTLPSNPGTLKNFEDSWNNGSVVPVITVPASSPALQALTGDAINSAFGTRVNP